MPRVLNYHRDRFPAGAVGHHSGSISNSVAGSVINWGAGVTFPPQSTITFTGNPLPANTKSPFPLGTLTYTNGFSNIDSLIFAATLTFFDSADPGTPLGSDLVEFNNTINTGDATLDADYITFSGLAGQSLNAFEGATPEPPAELNGFIDELTLTSLILPPDASGGFIGDDPPLPLTAPEPASLALLGLGIIGLSLTRRR
jgi:hypothetical protein